MARYIDADALLNELKEELEFDSPMYNEVENNWLKRGLRIAIKDVKHFPTADVVPRIELDAMRSAANSYKMHYENARSEAVTEVLQMIENICAYEECLSYEKIEEGIKRQMALKASRTKADRCIVCGEIVPEGRQICSMCETGQEFWKKRKGDDVGL